MQGSGVTSMGTLPDSNSDMYFSHLKTQSLNTNVLQVMQTAVIFLKEIFFTHHQHKQKHICFHDVPWPCKKIELFKGFCIVHILSKGWRRL